MSTATTDDERRTMAGVDDDDERPAGSSSLVLSIPSTSAMMVEFPGYVRDVPAALEVLGGEQVETNWFLIFFAQPSSRPLTSDDLTPPPRSLFHPPLKKIIQALAAAAEGRARYLTARLRPGDPLSHPLVSSAVRQGSEKGEGTGEGEIQRRGLLLRVAKKQEGQNASTTTTTTTVAAVVSSGVSFPGLADVQYAGWDARAPRSQAGRGVASASAGVVVVAGGAGSGDGGGLKEFLPGEPLLAVPPVFFASDVAHVAPASGIATDKAK